MPIADGPCNIPPPAFDDDTLEARTIRAEAAAHAWLMRSWRLENELRAVDDALQAERVPRHSDVKPLAQLTRYGRIRWLGDQRRKAKRGAVPHQHRLAVEALAGQLDVYDCIAEVQCGS